MNKFLVVFLGILTFFLVGCDNNEIFKSEYYMNETGYIDDLNLTLKSASWNENRELELIFEIENKTNRTITISPDENFRLYDVNMVQVPNTYSNSQNIIKKNEKLSVTLNYKVTEKKMYEIYFYSGIVENNIKFSFTDTEIK